ncbi:MAG TPA: extracellular solute-binding protein [Devosiaceae bacterium]|jgi:ABC-type glycerol-3-phosphate transport system substrate-binding protein|nr:extracellular solute-binding protein [Devosiaceae bacterium]
MRLSFTCAIGLGLALMPAAAMADTTNISFLTHWAPDTVAKLEAAASAYSKDHPDVAVTVRAVPFGDLLTTLRASGGGAGGATIAGIYNAWLPDLAKDKLLAPIPDDMGAEVKADWPAGIVGASSTGGVLYGFPNEIDLYALNYNKKLFEAAGIKEPPKTWDEFTADAKALTDKSKGQQGFGLINSWTAGVIHPFASLLASNGGELVTDGKPQLDSDAAKETFALYESLVKNGYSDPTMGTSDANTTGPFLDNFVSGKTGMIIMANWWESALKSGMGDSFADIATAPIPVGPHGDKPHSISYSWMTVVNAKASPAEQKAAWDFLSWLNGPTSGPNGGSAMGDILISMGILPSRTSDTKAFADKLADPFLKAYIDEVPDAKPFPVVLGGQEFSESLQQHLEAVQFGKESAADASSGAQADAAAILSKAAQ